MKMSKQINGIVLSLFLAMGLSLSGCIKPEAPNAEADIVKCIVGQDLLFRSIHITNESVEIPVNGWVDVTIFAPKFEVTEGATIEPASGTPRDFTTPQQYKLTSEDGKWSKAYTVKVVKPNNEEQPVWTYSFEGLEWKGKDDKKFPVIVELASNDKVVLEWQNGNIGALLSGTGFYTTQEQNGYKGNAAKLETKSTGPLGAMFSMPIAAGNIYLGKLDSGNLFTEPLKATHFGLPFFQEPIRFAGYYKYQPGEVVTDADLKVVEGKVDNFSLYAIFFETTDQVQWLDGTNVQDSPQLISVARVTEHKVSDDWVYFSIPFVMREGKTIDQKKLKEGKYSYSIIASSSENGDIFEGAVGSTLWIDELQIFCK